MPRLNLKDDSLESEQSDSERTIAPPPTLRDVGGGGGSSPLLLIVIIIVVLAAGAFALNQFGIIHLWGKKAPQVTESLPPPDFGEGESESGTVTPEGEPAPTEGEFGQAPTPPSQSTAQSPTRQLQPTRPTVTIPTSGSGDFTVQVSSWMSRSKADEEAAKLTSSGYTAFVEEASVGGEVWYRVRVGHYATEGEAKEAASQLQQMMEGTIWVAKAGR
jgi:hypothetical protein